MWVRMKNADVSFANLAIIRLLFADSFRKGAIRSPYIRLVR